MQWGLNGATKRQQTQGEWKVQQLFFIMFSILSDYCGDCAIHTPPLSSK